MGDPPPPVQALFSCSVHDELTLTLADTYQIGAIVSSQPNYSPFDPTGTRTRGSFRLRCMATRRTYQDRSLPSAQLLIDAVERRVWDPPTVNVYDPVTEPARGNAHRITESRWQVLGELIGVVIDD
jgi:hypothetical protein